MKRIHVRVAARTDRGRVRAANEDAFVVSELSEGAEQHSHGRIDVGANGVLLAVSDGMGGAHAGHIASALVLHTLERAMSSMPSNVPDALKVTEAIQRAHDQLVAYGRDEGRRMGATLTAVYVHGEQAFIAEVGDSRAYLIRAGRLVRLTRDQSVVQRLLDAGVLDANGAAHSPFRNVILQAMGHQEKIQVELGRLELRERDCFVLCSDGLTRYASDEEIRTLVLGSSSLDLVCDRLVDLANARGGEDNITVIAAGVAGGLKPPVEKEIETTQELLATFTE